MSRIELPDCARCRQLSPDRGYVCARCGEHLRRALLHLADLAGDLRVDIARQARRGARAAAGAPEPPMLYEPTASDAAWAAGNTVVTWMIHVAEHRGLPLPPPLGRPVGPLCPAGWNTAPGRCRHPSCDTIRAGTRPHPIGRAANWLAGHVDWLRHRPEAAEAFDELGYAAAVVQRTVQGPSERWYAGPCGEADDTGDQCVADLYARPGALLVRCPGCGREHDAAARKQWLLQVAEDHLDTATALAAAATALGRQVTAAAIRGYAHRGRLLAHGSDAWARPVYRFGDVLDLVEQSEQARGADLRARAKRAAAATRHDVA